MAVTDKFEFPILSDGQGSPEITLNTATVRQDILMHFAIINRTTTNAPIVPTNGDAYIIGGGTPSGGDAWEGHEDDIAYYSSGWIFITPFNGILVYNIDTDTVLVYDGTSNLWDDVGGGGGGGAPTSSDYITHSNEIGDLAGSRQLIGTSSQITLDDISAPNRIQLHIAQNPILPGTWFRVPIKPDPDPSGASNGDMFYNTTSEKFRVFEDGAWVNVTDVGGGGSAPLISYKDADQIFEQGFANDSELAITLLGGTRYLIEGYLIHLHGALGGSWLNVTFDDDGGVGPTNPDVYTCNFMHRVADSTQSNRIDRTLVLFGDTDFATLFGFPSGISGCHIHGVVETSVGEAGTLQLRCASNLSGGGRDSLLQGSWLKVWNIG